MSLPRRILAAAAAVIGGRRPENSAGPLSSKNLAARAAPSTARAAPSGTLVAYASQTGTAEALARRTADALTAAGIQTTVRDVAALSASEIARYEKAFFVISTTGDGDAPDLAVTFTRRVMRSPAKFPDLRYAVLALGDRQYPCFCTFGLDVDEWLKASGAQTMFPTVQVDNLNEQALAQWASHLGTLTNSSTLFTVHKEPFRPWRLVERMHINPGSAGGEVWHLEFDPSDAGSSWDAGDIAQIGVECLWAQFETRGSDALIEREYSIASTSEAGRIHLLVRRMVSAEGKPGIGSTFLTTLPLGATIPLRVRRNPGFHGPKEDCPMILIGNGTGIAGLRAHLMRRATLGHRRSWLIFGERNAATDAFYANDLERLRASGHLERADFAFSRDQPQRRYVQDLLGEVADEMREWINAGAAVYVCGSLRGMAPAVTEQLTRILGEEALERLTLAGRYCRDVY